MPINSESLKSFLVDSRLVSNKDFDLVQAEALSSEAKLEDLLISKGFLTEDDLRRVLAYVLGLPFVDLKREHISRDVLTLIPEPLARQHNLVAYKKTGATLEVAMLDWRDWEEVGDFLKKGGKLKILPRFTDDESMKKVLVHYQKILKTEFGDIIRKESLNFKNSPKVDTLEALAEDPALANLLKALLAHAILQKALDIHLEPQEKELVVRYRLAESLHDAMILPSEITQGLVARLKVFSHLDLAEERFPQAGRFQVSLDGQKVSFLISILPTQLGEKIVLRRLLNSTYGETLEAGGFHGEGLEKVQRALGQTTGLVVVAGPVGSGQTTTLYTFLDILNTPDVNISTIEDPIGHQIPRINQTQVRPDIGLTFATGLRALIDQDTDIIMVGEIRDRETASLAFAISQASHLVLTTLQAPSAIKTISRLLNLGVEPLFLVSSLRVIVAQCSVRRLCSERESYFLTEAEVKSLATKANLDRVLDYLKREKIVTDEANWRTIPFYRSKSEQEDFGWVNLQEVLSLSPALRELILMGSLGEELSAQARSEGMLTLLEDGIFKSVQGLTTLEEVLSVLGG